MSTGQGGPIPSVATASGAFLNTLNTVRSMRLYTLNDTELEVISHSNTWMSVLASFGTTIVALAIGLQTNAVMQSVLTPQAAVLAEVGFPVGLVLGGLCYVGAIVQWRIHHCTLDRIRKETRVI